MDTFEKLKQKYLIPAQNQPKPPKKVAKFKRNVVLENVKLPDAEILPTRNVSTPVKNICDTPKLGAHVSIKNGYKSAAMYAFEQKYNCFQIFTQSPRGSKRAPKKVEDTDIEGCTKFMEENNMELWIHCPYTVNFCRKCCENTQYLRDAVLYDMGIAKRLGKVAKGCVMHVGKLNCDECPLTYEQGMINLKHNIETVIQTMLQSCKNDYIPWLLIETAAGQGTETPVTVEGLSELYFSINESYRKYVGFCVDTCHIFASGECDLRSIDEIDNFIKKWNKHIGWPHVKLIHFNDSKEKFDSHVDRHLPVGEGKIGNKGLNYFKDFCILTGKSIVSEW